MQIDFHHGVTYALARIAGFPSEEAAIVAYASQYVDDAVESGMIAFVNGSAFARISSAHRMLDYRNFEALADHLVWLPFHFLPGNGGLPAGEEPDGPFIRKLVCVPNSPVAQDMLKSVIRDRDRPYALHRLGISMHVYADTWAHQGFAGFPHEVNHATDVTGPDGSPDLRLQDKLTNYFLNAALPLGHGTVLSNPDKPYLVWAYTNGLGERISRDNPADFLDAAEHMVRAMQCFRAGAYTDDVPGLPPADSVVIQRMLREVVHADENERHKTWLYQIEQGAFSFGPDRVQYVGEGPGSWKTDALGADAASRGELSYRPEFLRCNWKRFHDALQAQRFDVLHHILPEYGICAA
jgi:hypothetical protein